MRRCSPVLLALHLVACGPGQPIGFDGETSDGLSLGDGDEDEHEDDEHEDDEHEDEGDGDGDELSVLFIGNSYTYTNDLPGLVGSMAAADSIEVEIESLTQGGAYVASHLLNPELGPLLARSWDVIVINGQPFEPVLEYPIFEQGVVDMLSMTGDARIVLYQTWPRRADNIELIELGMTVEQMWAGLEQGYAEVAQQTDSEVATVGAAWMNALELDPPIQLYSIDGNHPSYAGTYLAACVIYGVLFDASCSTNGYFPVGMPPEDVSRLQIVADITNGELDP